MAVPADDADDNDNGKHETCCHLHREFMNKMRVKMGAKTKAKKQVDYEDE